MSIDPLHRVLYIDLTRKQSHVENRPDLFEQAMGGTGVAIRLLEEECPRGADPLGPDNPIVLAVGPLTGLFPMASKTVAMFKSPLTGNLGESHAGGRSAVSIRLAGYGALVIRGASESPVYLAVHGDEVHFRDASALWGMTNSHTVGRVIREREPGSGTRTIMRIGRAGERLVRFACVITETYRHFGRLGLGAVFGSKKLKAIAISGNRSLPVADPKLFRQVYDDIFQSAVDSPVMRKYHEIGTAENVAPLNRMGGLPTMNLTRQRFDGAEDVSGERMARDFLGRRIACAHCPVACVHIAALREPYEQEPYFYKTSMISYDYEPIYAMGSMLGINDAAALLKLLDDVERYGIDVMSAGVALAWATEALERGLLTAEDVAGADMKWGAAEPYRAALRLIMEQPNDFYRALGRGVEHASSVYGGSDFALAFGGNEMAGYHTGPGAHAGLLMGSRHSHLDSAGYGIDQKAMSPPTPSEIAHALVAEESWRQVLSSAVVCFFARGIYTEDRIANALDAAGHPIAPETLHRTGEDILRRKYAFKCREGFSHDGLRIPKRILETPSASGTITEETLRETVELMHKALQPGGR